MATAMFVTEALIAVAFAFFLVPASERWRDEMTTSTPAPHHATLGGATVDHTTAQHAGVRAGRQRRIVFWLVVVLIVPGR